MVGLNVYQNNRLCLQDSNSMFWYKVAEDMEV